jgi:hypothetical protein
MSDDHGRRRLADSGSPVTRPTGERRLELHDGLVNRFGEGQEDGNSPGVLSTVAWVGQRGTAVVVRTRGRRRQLAGRRGSGRRWGPRGGENEGGRWPEMADVDKAPLMEMAHGVGWLRGLFTAAGSR